MQLNEQHEVLIVFRVQNAKHKNKTNQQKQKQPECCCQEPLLTWSNFLGILRYFVLDIYCIFVK